MAVDRSTEDRSLADLLRELARQMANLVRQEIALARSEVSEKMARVARSLAALVVGGVVATCGAVFVLLSASQAAVMGLLALGMGAVAARVVGPLVVGALTLTGAWVLVRRALIRLGRESIVPERTARTLSEERQWLTDKLT